MKRKARVDHVSALVATAMAGGPTGRTALATEHNRLAIEIQEACLVYADSGDAFEATLQLFVDLSAAIAELDAKNS